MESSSFRCRGSLLKAWAPVKNVAFLADSVRILYLPMICSITESKDDPNFDLRFVNKIPGKYVDA